MAKTASWMAAPARGGQSGAIAAMNETIRLLSRRRSLSPANLAEPGPTAAELETLLTIASRVPDHGKLTEPARSAELARFAQAPLVVAVVSRAAPHVKIPEWEQVLSAGAVCMSLTIAANALGFATAWVTEWCAYDRRFATAIGLSDHERVAGFIHIGRAKVEPQDRPRPPLTEIVTAFAL